jgi:hypothetical protein
MPAYIHKTRVHLDISEPGREPMKGVLALAPLSDCHSGPETVLDLLNSRARVVPVTRPADGTTVLFTRLQIAWVLAGCEVGQDLVWPGTYQVTKEERVLVEMEDGSLLAGRIQMELPEYLNRASDFLNGDEDFFPLIARAGIYLINKSKVRATQLFEASPLPIAAA